MDDEEIDMMLAEAVEDIKDELLECDTNDPSDVRRVLCRIHGITLKALA